MERKHWWEDLGQRNVKSGIVWHKAMLECEVGRVLKGI